MSEPKRQKRGEAQRIKVLDATLELLAREGPRGVTHRAVAKEAGTSVRATTYYFDSREQLLMEALQHYAAGAVARFEEMSVPISSLAEADDPVLAGARLLALVMLSDFGPHRSGLIAEYELVLETARNPRLEDTYRAWQRQLEGMLRRYCEAVGSEDAAADARLILATLRGLEMEALARPGSEPDFEDLTAVFARLLRGMAAARG